MTVPSQDIAVTRCRAGAQESVEAGEVTTPCRRSARADAPPDLDTPLSRPGSVQARRSVRTSRELTSSRSRSRSRARSDDRGPHIASGRRAIRRPLGNLAMQCRKSLVRATAWRARPIRPIDIIACGARILDRPSHTSTLARRRVRTRRRRSRPRAWKASPARASVESADCRTGTRRPFESDDVLEVKSAQQILTGGAWAQIGRPTRCAGTGFKHFATQNAKQFRHLRKVASIVVPRSCQSCRRSSAGGLS